MKLIENTKPKLIVVGGPTASGKTAYAIKLAKKMNGELINADSRQIYNSLDIGTNKGTLTQTQETFQPQATNLTLHAYDVDDSSIKGWLFNIIDPDQEFNLTTYKNLADEIIVDIITRGKQPILVGGTGLYIDAVIKNYQLEINNGISNLRDDLNQKTATELYQQLDTLNSTLAENLNTSDKSNPRRLIRHIEKLTTSDALGKVEYTQGEMKYDVEFYYPIYDRAELMAKIDKRVIKMVNQGLFKETRTAIISGYLNTKPMQSFGYREAFQYLDGQISKEKCIELIQLEHRKYAKRQITWFEGKGRKYDLIKGNF